MPTLASQEEDSTEARRVQKAARITSDAAVERGRREWTTKKARLSTGQVG